MTGREALNSPVGQELTSTLVQVGLASLTAWIRSRHANPDSLTAEQIAAEAKALLEHNAESAEEIYARVTGEDAPAEPTEG
jgi:hypothetical protein